MGSPVNADRTLARAAATVGMVLGAATLLLAAVGVFGMLAFRVRMQRSELAVRLALGATGRQILTRVIVSGLGLGAVGGLVGMPLGLAVGHAISDLAVGSRPFHPMLVLAVTLGLGVVLFAAVLVPALRASRLGPSEALSVL